jgi:hypothetical protein
MEPKAPTPNRALSRSSTASPSLRYTLCGLGLTIEGRRSRFRAAAHRELNPEEDPEVSAAMLFDRRVGMSVGQPTIGIPFYLARPTWRRSSEHNDLEDSREIMKYLRHEAGHAFNYAYKLHRTPEWKELFGPYRRPYRENYRPVLFSKEYVRYLPGWYAQKHPDEDFAETFAVWMTPRSSWRKKYRGWPALAKLNYMDRIERELGNADPLRKRGTPDITVADMEVTVGEFYRHVTEQIPLLDLNLDDDLAALFNTLRKKRSAEPAQAFLARHRKMLVDQLASWTAMQRPLLRKLMESIEKRSGEMELFIDRRKDAEHLSEFTVFATTLVMNHLARSKASSVS